MASVTWQALEGCRVQRIDLPAPALLSIELRSPTLDGYLVVVLCGPRRGVGLAPARPRGAPAGAFARRLRKLLVGSRVSAAEALEPGCVRLRLATRAGGVSLHAEFDRKRGNVVLTGEDGALLAQLHHTTQPYTPGGAPGASVPATLEGLRAAGPPLAAGHAADALDETRRVVSRAIRQRRRRLARRLEAIAGDAARAGEAPAMRARAQALISQLHALSPDAREVSLVIHDVGGERQELVAIPPGMTPHGLAERLFKQAGRLERGAIHAQTRRDATEAEIAALDALGAELENASSQAEIDSVREAARSHGVASEAASAGRAARTRERRLPYREYALPRGFVALVGRGAADNDQLTLKVARPHDLFLHARDVTGAHVILRLQKGEICPPDVLADAAMLAAHFSDARGEQIVDVTHVPRRHVRKPRGAPPGMVQLQREKVLAVRVDADRIAKLLDSLRA